MEVKVHINFSNISNVFCLINRANYLFLFSEIMTSMLENADMGIPFPDVQFWKMASYPVLASDAFSTLMWIFFCLPVPLMSSEKAFLPLVHMCYIVSITQVHMILQLLYLFYMTSCIAC